MRNYTSTALPAYLYLSDASKIKKQCLALYQKTECNALPPQQSSILLQTIVSWTAEDGSFVHRVVTRRLQVTTSRVSALRGVDCETSALLLAKRVMQEARVRDAASNPREAEKLQRAIGEHSLLLLTLEMPKAEKAYRACARFLCSALLIGRRLARLH